MSRIEIGRIEGIEWIAEHRYLVTWSGAPGHIGQGHLVGLSQSTSGDRQ